MKNQSTRVLILELLAQRKTITARELAGVLGMTAANVRHHLLKLTQDGRVIQTGTRNNGQRGRPTRVFALARQRDNLENLSHWLLQALQESTSDAAVALLTKIAGTISPTLSEMPITPRLNQTIHALEKYNYEPRWEAHRDGARIIFENCPYSEIINRHPELCGFDLAILENALDLSVEQIEKLAVNQLGVPICVFRIRNHTRRAT